MSTDVKHSPDRTDCPACAAEAKTMEKHIGRYARSIESGWLGKVLSVEGDMLKMCGVNELTRTIAGGDIEDHVDDTDVQWFAPEDLKFLVLV